eukprot:3622129-Rhodomonas_salina.1
MVKREGQDKSSTRREHSSLAPSGLAKRGKRRRARAGGARQNESTSGARGIQFSGGWSLVRRRSTTVRHSLKRIDDESSRDRQSFPLHSHTRPSSAPAQPQLSPSPGTHTPFLVLSLRAQTLSPPLLTKAFFFSSSAQQQWTGGAGTGAETGRRWGGWGLAPLKLASSEPEPEHAGNVGAGGEGGEGGEGGGRT